MTISSTIAKRSGRPQGEQLSHATILQLNYRFKRVIIQPDCNFSHIAKDLINIDIIVLESHLYQINYFTSIQWWDVKNIRKIPTKLFKKFVQKLFYTTGTSDSSATRSAQKPTNYFAFAFFFLLGKRRRLRWESLDKASRTAAHNDAARREKRFEIRDAHNYARLL